MVSSPLQRLTGEARYSSPSQVQLRLVSTLDPYYAALPLDQTSHNMTNRAVVENRLSLLVEAFGCGNVTEGGPASRGYGVSGARRCNVTVTLCLAATGTCTDPLSAADVYSLPNGARLPSPPA